MHPARPQGQLERVMAILGRVQGPREGDDRGRELWRALEAAALGVLAHELPPGEELPEGLREDGIPEGYWECTGCRRILWVCEENFRREATKKNGFRGRCKRCMPKRGHRVNNKRDREEEEEEGPTMVVVTRMRVGNEEEVPLADVPVPTQVELQPEPILVSSGAAKKTRKQQLQCDRCAKRFHWDAAGYSREPQDVAWCASCLREFGVSPNGVLSREDERVKLDAYFASPDRQWDRRVIRGDGACLMQTTWEWLGHHNNAFFKTRAAMIKAIGKAAIQVIEEVAQEQDAGNDGKDENERMALLLDREECIEVWREIVQNVGKVKELWSTGALDFAWQGLHRVCPWICIQIWQLDSSSNALSLLQQVPEHPTGEFQVLPVLLSSRWVMAHYDLLSQR